MVEHSPVTYIRTQLTTPQPRGQMLESSIEFDLVEHWFIPKTRERSISTDKQPSHILQHFDSNFPIIPEPWHPSNSSDSIMNVETVWMQCYLKAKWSNVYNKRCRRVLLISACAWRYTVYHTPLQKVQSRSVSILVYFLSSGVILTQCDTIIRWCAQSLLRDCVQRF